MGVHRDRIGGMVDSLGLLALTKVGNEVVVGATGVPGAVAASVADEDFRHKQSLVFRWVVNASGP